MARFASFVLLALAAAIASFATASAQTPTDAQKQALRSNCPKDFRHNCSGVPTGGMAALVCLEQHVDKLSAGCKAAVQAVSGGSTTAAAPAAKTPAAAPAAAPPVPEEKAAAAPAATHPAPVPQKSAAPIAAVPPAVAPGPQLPFFMELRITARSCAPDFRKLCPDVPLGHGNAIFCLKVHAPKLDPACRAALKAAGERLE